MQATKALCGGGDRSLRTREDDYAGYENFWLPKCSTFTGKAMCHFLLR